jgi:hypothetical protein
VTVSAWEAFFFIVVLKIPVVYLGIVVWWAVRAVPEQPGHGDGAAVLAPIAPCGWDDWRRRRSSRARRGRPLGPSLRGSRAEVR